MDIQLTQEEKQSLELRHRSERDRLVADRIKAVLLRNEGWDLKKIAQALRLHEETIRTHISDYYKKEKLKPENGGSNEKLSSEQCEALDLHLQKNTHVSVSEICEYVLNTFGYFYTKSGMTDWLKAHKFSYKMPKGVPAKMDKAKQEEFIEAYKALKNALKTGEKILFLDSVHPTQATKISHGWFKKGKDKLISTTASRTRINMTGALCLETLKVSYAEYETINAISVVDFFKKIELEYAFAPRIHIILDQAGYHKAELVAKYLENSRIELHLLPPYSPNLNPIERIWKVMNEKVRNNRYFPSPKEFREAIRRFFTDILPKITDSLRTRITDNFQRLDPVS